MFGNRLTNAEGTKNLLIVNVVMYAATFIAGMRGIDLNAMMGMYYIDAAEFRFWQPLSHMFMHGSLGHIFFNMFNLFTFGMILERVWGTRRFLLFYFICGFGAALIQQSVYAITVYNDSGRFFADVSQQAFLSQYHSLVIGASGAVVGLIVAFGLLFPNTELFLMFIPVPVKAKYMVLIMLAKRP